MSEDANIKVVHTYQGKQITQSFVNDNKHLFTEPDPLAVEIALNVLRKMQHSDKKYSLFIDETGRVFFMP